jgi:hypothetical protein
MPHLCATITRNGIPVGLVDVHLHHNASNFSLGLTVHHRNTDVPQLLELEEGHEEIAS